MPNAVAKRLDSIQEHSGISDAMSPSCSPPPPRRCSGGGRSGLAATPLLERLLTLEWLTSQLADYYSADKAKLWLFSPHRQLGGARPADLIAEQRTDDVLQLIDQLDSAAYI